MKAFTLSALALSALMTSALGFTATRLAAAAAPIRIGVGGPMTGSDAVFGTQMRNGVEQAVHDINAAGGILGKTLTVEIGDDAGDPKRAAPIANKFIADHVNFVVGHFNSGATLPASAIYAEHDILEITPASTNPQITERGLETLFRTCGRDDQQTAVAAKFLARFGTRKIAILHDRTSYGKGLADATRAQLAKLGIKDVLYDSVDKGEQNYSSLMAKIKASGADIVYWGGQQTEAALILRQMREHGVKAALMASDAIAADDFASVAGDATIGTYMTFPSDPRNRPEAANVLKEFKARNIDPETYTLYSYAAVEVIKQAVERAKSLDPIALAKLMHTGMHFKTVLGNISFDAKGDITRPDYIVFIWRKGPDGKISYYPLKK